MIRNVSYQRSRLGAGGANEASGLISSAAPAAALIPGVGPFVAAGLEVAAGVVRALGIGNGCGGSCVAATQVVNAIIPAMQQNLAAAQAQVQANGGCLTSAEQTQLLNSFDQLWQTIVQDCTQIGGDGGSQCISDRQRGGKYDCFATLRDPISAMSICATPATSSASDLVSAALNSVTSGITSNPLSAGIPTWLYVAAAGLVGFLLLRPSE